MKRLLSILLSLVLTNLSNAQLVIDGATLSVGSDATFYIDGDAESSGNVINNGSMYMTGDWVNAKDYLGKGRVYLIGENQIFSHGNDTIAFLYVDSQDEGDKQVPASCVISDSLVLLNGKLIVDDAANLILLEKARTSLGNEDSYVDGYLYAKLVSRKAYYPVGNSQEFAPIELQNIESAGATIGYKAISPIPEDLTFSKSVENAISETYWHQNILSGRISYAQYALAYEPVDLIDGREVNVIYSDNMLGEYKEAGADADLTSQIEKTYVISSDTIHGDYLMVGAYIKAAWELLFIPNALSKYAPDENDKAIRVYGNVLAPDGFYFCVRNQWGNKIFETNSLELMETEGWSGTNQETGNREISGQYFYIVNGVGRDGKSFKDAGSIWIID